MSIFEYSQVKERERLIGKHKGTSLLCKTPSRCFPNVLATWQTVFSFKKIEIN